MLPRIVFSSVDDVVLLSCRNPRSSKPYKLFIPAHESAITKSRLLVNVMTDSCLCSGNSSTYNLIVVQNY